MVSFCPKREETVQTPPTVGVLLTNHWTPSLRLLGAEVWVLLRPLETSGSPAVSGGSGQKASRRDTEQSAPSVSPCFLPRALGAAALSLSFPCKPLPGLRFCRCILSEISWDLAQAEATAGLTRSKEEHLVPLQAQGHTHLTSPTAGRPPPQGLHTRTQAPYKCPRIPSRGHPRLSENA